MTTATVVRPSWDTRVAFRDYVCACGGFLLSSNATDGSARVKCRRCREWKIVELNATEQVARERKRHESITTGR